MNDIACPWGAHTHITARRAQGEVRIEEDLTTDLNRFPLLLFRRREDGHLISGINPTLSLCPRSSGIARTQCSDYLFRIRKRGEKRNRAMAEHRRRLGCFVKVSHHYAGIGIVEKIDHRTMAAGDENGV